MISKKELIAAFQVVSAVMAVVSFVVFWISILGTDVKSKTGDYDCRPESILMMINIPWRAGCELGLRRWKDEQ